MDANKYFEEIEQLKFLAKKEVGQNFLIDKEKASLIVSSLELTEKDNVLEIGCGAGSLSYYLSFGPATATIVGESAYYEHIPLKTLTAYTSTSGKKVAYKIYKGEEVYFVSLYKSGSKKYVKIKNANGKYGWVKVGNTKLFE